MARLGRAFPQNHFLRALDWQKNRVSPVSGAIYAWGTRSFGAGAIVSDAPLVPISLNAGTLHVTAHIVTGYPPTTPVAGTLHVTAHIVTGQIGIAVTAGTLHETAHLVAALTPTTPVAGTQHVTAHPVAAKTPTTPVAGTQHSRAHIVTATLSFPLNLSAGTLHVSAHIVGIGVGFFVTNPIVVPLNSSIRDPYNPRFTTAVAATPVFSVVLMDGSANAAMGAHLTGSTVTFSLHELGGATLFTRAAVIDSILSSKVHYSTQAGDTATAGKYLGRFHVHYSDSTVQDFPDDRYIELEVT